jgi:hypothetical protein
MVPQGKKSVDLETVVWAFPVSVHFLLTQNVPCHPASNVRRRAATPSRRNVTMINLDTTEKASSYLARSGSIPSASIY